MWVAFWAPSRPTGPRRPSARGDGVGDAAEDFDGDGVSNGDEDAEGTDPGRPDADGADDGDESVEAPCDASGEDEQGDDDEQGEDDKGGAVVAFIALQHFDDDC